MQTNPALPFSLITSFPAAARFGWRFLSWMAALAVCGVVAASWREAGGPVYRDRAAVEWLSDLGAAEPALRVAAAEAIRHLGPSCLPQVRAFLRREDHWMAMRWRQIAEDQDWGGPRGLTAYQARMRGALACEILGEQAVPLLPELLRLLEDHPDAVSSRALAALGPAAVEPLTKGLASTSDGVRIWSAMALGRLFVRQSGERPRAWTGVATVSGGAAPVLLPEGALPSLLQAMEADLEDENGPIRWTMELAKRRLREASSLPRAVGVGEENPVEARKAVARPLLVTDRD